MDQPFRPSLTRRQSSAISINDGDFEWLKSYFTREDESQGAEQPLPSAPVPLAGQLPPMVVPPGHGQKHKHEDTLPSMSMVTQEDVEDEETLRKRRKVGWTNTEDLTILAAVRRIGTQWQRIADNLPGRTADAVRNRWHRLQKTHALNDTEEGRSALDGLLVASGVDPDWCPPELSTPSVSDAIGASAAAAEPMRIVGSDHGRHMWSAEEDRIIEDGVRRLGCKWRQIAALLPNRTDSSVRNRWMRLCKEGQTQRASFDGGTPPPFAAGPLSAATGSAPAAAATPSPFAPRPMGSGSVAPALSSQEEANKMLDELSDSIKGIEVDRGNMPLGLSAPMDLVDLDSFVEAVSACVEGDVLERRNSMTGGALDENLGLPRFSIDEEAGAQLAASKPRSGSVGSRRASLSQVITDGIIECTPDGLSGGMAAALIGTVAIGAVAAIGMAARSRSGSVS